MKLNSKYFDSIRAQRADEAVASSPIACAWSGCTDCGLYPAPMGRGHEGKYAFYCLSHVKEYNKNYNYFSGMDDGQIAAFQKEAIIGHRPTWRMNGRTERGPAAAAAARFAGRGAAAEDPMAVFEKMREGERQRRERPVHNAARRAFRTLDLDTDTAAPDIKRRFHDLVKRHHPDVNGGDKESEAKLREVIAAYNCLKAAGMC